MFRCFNCGKAFDNDEILELSETLGTIKEPPSKVSYVCPYCKCNMYKPFIKDSISRRQIIDSLIDVMQKLNIFEHKLSETFNSSATNGTELDVARSNLFELFTVLAGDDEFALPRNIDEKIFYMMNTQEASALYEILTKNIEGD